MRDRSSPRFVADTIIRGGLAVVLYSIFPAFSDIHRLWERQAGLVPGWPFGVFEYPPVGALYFAPFGLLPSSTWAVVVNGMIMLAAAVAVTAILMRLTPDPSHEDVDVGMWVSSPALLLLLPINWDVLIALMMLWGVVAVSRSRPIASGMWLGAGTAFKVFPGSVVLPILPLLRKWPHRMALLGSGAVVLGGSYLIYALADPEGWRFHLDFAALRDDTQSTIWGVLERVIEVFGANLSLETINTASTITVIVAVVAVTLWVARAKPSFQEAAAVAIMVLLAFNKVFKPQYVLWVIPFLAWIGASRVKVRILETTAIVQFAVIYFALPEIIYVAETGVRLVIIFLLCTEIIRSRFGEHAVSAT